MDKNDQQNDRQGCGWRIGIWANGGNGMSFNRAWSATVYSKCSHCYGVHGRSGHVGTYWCVASTILAGYL
jgi:hypothetical protein